MDPSQAAAVSCGVATAVGQTLEKLTGEYDRSIGTIAMNSIVDAGIGAIAAKAFVPRLEGITAGRNHMGAVFQSGLTRISNKNAARMSAKVIRKGITSGSVGSTGWSTINGYKSRLMELWGRKTPSYSNSGQMYWEPAR